MSRQVIEKLSSVDKQAGSYAIGQKAVHQEFPSIPHSEKLRKAFLAWSGRYLQSLYIQELGQTLSNYIKLYPTLTADKSGDIEQEMVDYQQTIGTGPQIGTTISVM